MGKIRRKRKISFKYLILAVVGLLLIYFFFFSSPPELDYRVLINCIREGKFEEMKISKIVDLVISTNLTTVIITGSIVLSSGRIVPFRTEVPNSIFSFDFVKSGVLKNPIISGGISIVDVSKPSFLSALLTQILVLLIFFGLAYFLMWQFQKKVASRSTQGGGSIFSSFLGTSMAKRSVSEVTFADVAGLVEEKQELVELLDYLKDFTRYKIAGARAPKGILLIGPPGTGKTLLAKALAGEASVPFFSVSGSEFEEVFVGLGASRVRETFANAKRVSPAIIFIDELDAIGSRRPSISSSNVGEQTLNQLLVEMDGFQTNSGLIVIGASNRWDNLDPALLRPGRFDRQVYVSLPTLEERVAILKIHSRDKTISPEVDFFQVARRTPGLSGAQLENALNEAALLAVRKGKKEIGLWEMNAGIDRAIGGIEKRSRVISERDRKIVSYHEAGHALVGQLVSDANVVQRVTIIPRGHSGGFTVVTPKEETMFVSSRELKDKMVGFMAGRAAEELIFGVNEVTTGSADDIKQATIIAKELIVHYGMGDLGYARYDADSLFSSRDAFWAQLSEETKRLIEKNVERLIDDALKRSAAILLSEREKLDLIAKSLLIHEELNNEDIKWIIENNKVLGKNKSVK